MTQSSWNNFYYFQTCLFKHFCVIASTTTQLMTHAAVITRVCIPKMNTERTSGGIKQAATVHIIFSTDSLLFICGDIEPSPTSAAVSADISVVCLMMVFLLLLFLQFCYVICGLDYKRLFV